MGKKKQETPEEKKQRVDSALDAAAKATESDYERWTVPQLRETAKERGLKPGKKTKVDLICELREHDQQHAGDELDPDADPDTETVSLETLSKPDQSNELTRPLHVPFDEDRLMEALGKLWRAYDELRGVEAEKSSANSQWNAQIKRLKDEADKLNRILQTGGEEEDVPCVETLHFREGLVVVVRTDTNVIVEHRPLTPEERQGNFTLVNELAEAPPENLCPDCCGEGVIQTPGENGHTLSKTCPTCKGSGVSLEAPSKPGKPE